MHPGRFAFALKANKCGLCYKVRPVNEKRGEV